MKALVTCPKDWPRWSASWMDTGNTTFSTSAGTPTRLTLIASSSPSPSPVRLSPVCSTDPSGLVRLLKKMKCWSDRILPSVPTISAEASRSKSAPVVVRTSQPSPTSTACRPGTSLDSETFPPLLRLTLMPSTPPLRRDRSRSLDCSGNVPNALRVPNSDVDAEIARDAGQAGAVALSHRPELPFVVVAVQLAEDHGGLGGRVLGQVVAGKLAVVA